MNRYARQFVFHEIGKEGQKLLLDSKVAIVGVGALGTVIANNLCRAGVGYIKIIDRDYVELTNLQRQILFTENDAELRLPKAIAAGNQLSKINSEIVIEPVVSDVNSQNIEKLIKNSDLVLDATDNMDTRLLLNEACHKHGIPWIYGAALGSQGMTMNILGEPCLRCFLGNSSEPAETCGTFGVLNTITNLIASVQSTEAIKILIKSCALRKELLSVDLWSNSFDHINVQKNKNCPVCAQKKYSALNACASSFTTLCGSNAIQVFPQKPVTVDFKSLAEKLKKIGDSRYNDYTLTFSDNKNEFVLFKDGRAIIKNAIDANNAKSLYREYFF